MSSTLTLALGTKVCAFKGTHKKFRGEVRSNPLRGKVLVANPRQEKWILLSDLRVSESEPFSPQVKILGEKPRVIDVDEELPIYRECQPDQCVSHSVLEQGIFVSPSEPEPENSLGFKEGSRVHIKKDAGLTKKLTYLRCQSGLVEKTNPLTVLFDRDRHNGLHSVWVKAEWLELQEEPEEYAGFRVAIEVIERKGQLSQRPGRIVRFEKIGNETKILIDVGGFEVYSHPDILSPLVEGEQLGFDLVEEESAVPFELEKGKRVYCDAREKRGEILGWRVMRPLPTDSPTEYVSVRFDDGTVTVVPRTELEEVIEEQKLLPIEQKYEPFESWREGEDVWSRSGFVDSLKEWAGFPGQPKKSVDLTGELQSKLTPTPVEYSGTTSHTTLESKISETFTQNQGSMTYSPVVSLATKPVTPEAEQESATPPLNQEQCSENSSGASVKPDPHSSFWSSLRDLSIEDLERGWEDYAWADTKASIQSSRALINLERNLRGSDYLSFPTLLSGRGKRSRDVGLTECEVWWKQHVIQEIGLQLSAEALACLHSFPSNWFRVICPPSPALPGIQEESQPESLEVRPLLFLKPASPLNGSNGSGEKSQRRRSPNKKPATGSLSRCVSTKKGKDYSTFQYNYDIKDPSTKRGWRTVKEGVPKCLSGALADAISEEKPIREILTLLGKEPRGEINE